MSYGARCTAATRNQNRNYDCGRNSRSIRTRTTSTILRTFAPSDLAKIFGDAGAALSRHWLITAGKSRSSKQLPTNQRDTDNAEKHEPNEIHPEDYGVCVAYDQSIAASTK
jgi:hypothetical protein